MSFTYSATAAGTAVTTLHRVRQQLGDTDSTAALFADEEINIVLGDRADNVLLTAADLCEQLCTRFAREFDFESDGQRFWRSQKVNAYRQMAEQFRARANGLAVDATTRVDGYSQDIDYQELAPTSRRGRVRAGYTDPDLPV